MKTLTVRQLRNKFKKIYLEEFDDPNESFMDFLLDLIPKEVLMEIIDKKINILREQVNLDEISFEKSYNFEIVVKKWTELPRVKLDKGESDTKKEFGKASKIMRVYNSAYMKDFIIGIDFYFLDFLI